MKLVVAAVVVTLLAPTGAAHAQDSKKGAAELLFNEGKKLLEEGKVAEACEKLEASQEIDPAIGTLLNLARCYETAGRTASAWQTYVEAEKLARSKKDRRGDGAKQRARQLEGKVPTLVIEVAEAHGGLVVTQSGVAFDAALFGVAVPIDPGTWVIEASAPGHAAFRESIDVAEGEKAKVVIRLEEEKPAVEPPAPVAPPVVDEDEDEDEEQASGGSPGRGRKLLGLVVAGAGVVALGGSTVLIVGARGDYDAVFDDGLCDRETLACTEEGHSAAAGARRKANLGTIAGAVGIVAVATGIVLYLTAPSGGARAEHTYVVPVVDGEQVGFAIGGAL